MQGRRRRLQSVGRRDVHGGKKIKVVQDGSREAREMERNDVCHIERLGRDQHRSRESRVQRKDADSITAEQRKAWRMRWGAEMETVARRGGGPKGEDRIGWRQRGARHPSCWDREAAGVVKRRRRTTRLGSPLRRHPLIRSSSVPWTPHRSTRSRTRHCRPFPQSSPDSIHHQDHQ